jgi:hypothetical protein
MDKRREQHLLRDLNDAFNSGATWFTAELFRLIAKGDREHRELLRAGFPDEVEVYERWFKGELR